MGHFMILGKGSFYGQHMTRVGKLVRVVQSKQISQKYFNGEAEKSCDLAKLYLVHLEWEPRNVIHDKSHMMLFLIIVPVTNLVIMLMFTFSLFMPCYLYYFYVESHQDLLSLYDQPVLFRLFFFRSPPGLQGGNTAQFGSYQAPRLFLVRLGFPLAMACFVLLGE